MNRELTKREKTLLLVLVVLVLVLHPFVWSPSTAR